MSSIYRRPKLAAQMVFSTRVFGPACFCPACAARARPRSTEVVDQAKTNVVLIVDEVQHAITSDDGNQMLLALKSARDAINPRPGTPGIS
jgi:hypothetical protein